MIRDEEDSEQKGSCQGGRLLDADEEGRSGQSCEGMPQVKGLKELKLPVRQLNSPGAGRDRIHDLPAPMYTRVHVEIESIPCP